MQPSGLLVALMLLLAGCSSVDSTYRAGSGFTKQSRLALNDTTPAGLALRHELFSRGFNLVSENAPASQADFVMKLVVRRSWRGVIAGTVPGTVEVVVTKVQGGDVVATASYDLGSMSYTGTQSSARMIADSLAEQVP